jgi:hypothetical protein
VTTRYVNSETLREAIGEADVDLESLGQVLEDAETVNGLVLDDPWLTEAALRSVAEGVGLDPDRVNAAIAVLVASGQLMAVNLTEKQIPTPPGEEAEPSGESS